MQSRSLNCWRSTRADQVPASELHGSATAADQAQAADVCSASGLLPAGTARLTRRETRALRRMLLLLPVLWLLGCSSQSSSETNGTSGVSDAPAQRTVTVTSYPLFWMTSQVCENTGTTVRSAAPESELSRNWSPRREDIQAMQASDLILMNGAGYEPWRQRVTLPESRVFDASEGFYDRFIRIPDAVTHQHGPEGAHSHPGTVWATWLDPELAAALFESVVRITGVAEQHTPEAARRLNGIRRALDDADIQLRKLADPDPEESVVVLADSPACRYLTDRLGWELRYLHWPAEDPASEAAIQAMQSELKELAADSAPIALLRCEQTEQTIARLSVPDELPVVEIDLIERPAEDDLPTRIRNNILRLQQLLTDRPD